MRTVSALRNVSEALASAVAEGLGIDMPPPMPRAIKRVPKPEIAVSKALSLMALPGNGGIAGRRIAILVGNGVKGKALKVIKDALANAQAVPRLLGSRLGAVTSQDGEPFEVDATLENSPSVLFDALVLPDGAEAVESLARDGHTPEFIKDQYRHCKTILALGSSAELLKKLGIKAQLPNGKPDPGLLIRSSSDTSSARDFVAAVGKHRHPSRDSDPPLI